MAAVERVGFSHCGIDRQETGEQKAQRIIRFKTNRAELTRPGVPIAVRSSFAKARRWCDQWQSARAIVFRPRQSGLSKRGAGDGGVEPRPEYLDRRH